MWRLVGGALLVFALSPLATLASPEKANKTQRKSPASQETIASGDVGQLPRQVEVALQNAKVPREALHVMVIDPQSSATPKLSHQAQASVNPASLMKLTTTTAAFDLLGPSFVWRTPVYVEGAIRDGVLQGNVYVRGSGDPRLNVER
jgi:D-alanyl-D-alanine carboxypeptidase/D-alanyl-D-alanine-endopeptidase (penicillin-binding protein 4)